MNQVQLKYARTRAEEIKKNKLSALQLKYLTKAVTLTSEQKLDALKKGEFTVDKNLIKNSYYWYNAIKFNKEVLASTDTEAVEKGKAIIDTAFTKLMDELILGDNEEALKLLAAFEKI